MKQFPLKAISCFSIALIISLTSCTSRNTPIDTSKMEREQIDYEVITDSLYTSEVGGFIYTGRYVVWCDFVNLNVFDGNFIHVVDPELKKEVASMGRKGNGPNEFNIPSVERYNGDSIYVYDLNKPVQYLISLTEAVEGRKPIIPLAARQDMWAWSKLLITKETQVQSNHFYKDTPFRYINGDDTIPFGQYAVNLDVDDMARQLLQMAIEYDANLEILICKAAYFPYVALYKKAGNSFELMTEIKEDFDYKVSNGGWIDFSRDGFFSCTLTKNYFVTLDYDYDKGEEGNARDNSSLPRTLFVRDHGGNMLRIFKLDEPVFRLTGCGKDNILYAVIAPQDPDRDESDSEYEIVRIDLGKAMKK